MSEVAVQLKDVSKAFHGHTVLEKVSFTVAKGEAFCLLGRSGTGKSVTLKIIIGLLNQDEGSVTIEEDQVQDLDRQNLMRVRKKVGFLFQNAALFDSISLGENLAFPLRRHGREEGKPMAESDINEAVRSTLADVGLEADAEKMPSDLSGGMRKRAGLARALVMNPEILLVDEPSSGLDSITAGEIYGLLERLKEKKKTLVMVTHDAVGSSRFADRMAILDQGRIVACGTPEELQSSDNQLARALIGGANT
jgi:phospholipid/cholesterol/gamma-HCH transport system ATP-binding protein